MPSISRAQLPAFTQKRCIIGIIQVTAKRNGGVREMYNLGLDGISIDWLYALRYRRSLVRLLTEWVSPWSLELTQISIGVHLHFCTGQKRVFKT